MIEFKDLNPVIQELIDIATKGFTLMETAWFRRTVIQNLKKESLCGIITVNRAAFIVWQALKDDIELVRSELT